MLNSFLAQRLAQAKSRQAQAAHHIRVVCRRINNAGPTDNVEPWVSQLIEWTDLERRWREACSELAQELRAEVSRVRRMLAQAWR